MLEPAAQQTGVTAKEGEASDGREEKGKVQGWRDLDTDPAVEKRLYGESTALRVRCFS